MKNILWILIILFFSGCTQKSVPLPKDGSALLVIPQEGILKHGNKGFAFFYSLLLKTVKVKNIISKLHQTLVTTL